MLPAVSMVHTDQVVQLYLDHSAVRSTTVTYGHRGKGAMIDLQMIMLCTPPDTASAVRIVRR